jgi:hypothetical protein
VSKKKRLLGSLLLLLLTLLAPLALRAPGAAVLPLRLLVAVGSSLALLAMGVLREEDRPLELLPAAVMALALLGNGAGSTAAQYAWQTFPALGLLLLALCGVQIVRTLWLRRGTGRFDARRAAGWFAVVLLACLHSYAERALLDQRMKADFFGTALALVLALGCGCLLLPFLRRERTAGPWLVGLGAALLAVWATANHLPKDLGAAQRYLTDLAGAQSLTQVFAFLAAGVYCLLPSRES